MQYMPEFIRATYDGEQKNDYALKAKIAMEGLATHPEDAEYIYAYAGSFLRAANNPQECIDHCFKVLPLLTKWECREDTLRTLTFAMKDLNKTDEAIEIKKQILEESRIFEPGRQFFYIEEIAEAYEEKEDHANAVKYFEMLDEDGRDEEIYKKLGNLYTKLKDYDSAAANYLKAAQWTSQESAWYWRSTGQMLALAGKEDEAKFYFDVALKINPNDAYAHYYHGVIYQNKGDVYRALHHYNEALKIQPQFAEVYNNLAAISFNEEGDVKGAIQHIETALQQSSDSRLQVSLYISLSTLYKKISDYDKHEYYKAKVMETMGFLPQIEDDEDDDYDDDDFEDEED